MLLSPDICGSINNINLKIVVMKNYAYLFFFLFIIISGCKDDDPEPTTGTLKGTITSVETSAVLADVRIIVYDLAENSPVANTTTGADGNYSVELDGGDYYLRLYKQGYQNIPPIDMAPIPVTITVGEETESSYEMLSSLVANGGVIQGKVTSGGNVMAGVLVVAVSGNNGYSSATDSDGNYYIYNVPAGNYSVKGWIAEYNSPELQVNVTQNTESTDNDIALTNDATGSISGTITFLATDNGEVDVALTHQETGEVIPGLRVMTSSAAYTISNIPNGTYIANAAFENDTYVLDPDWVIKNGLPEITLAGSAETLDFSVTGSVELTSPTNAMDESIPVEINNATPDFTWVAYSSTSDYIIEVSDVNGNIIWGGFSGSGNSTTKNIIIPKDQLSIAFNSDGNANISALEVGKVYRWKIYASKDDTKEVVGWKLISASEERRGLIKIIQ